VQQHYETALLRGAVELAERRGRVEPLLAPLELVPSDTRIRRPTMLFEKMERHMVWGILYFCYVPPLLTQALSHIQPPITALERQAQKLRLLLKAELSLYGFLLMAIHFFACFDSAAIAATLSTSGGGPFTLSVAERSRRASQWIVLIKRPYKMRDFSWRYPAAAENYSQ
jgi:hypothetical protein